MKTLSKILILNLLMMLSLFAYASDTNLALGRTATQSSLGHWNDGRGVASNAIDGNRDGNWGSASVTHTTTDTAYEWWALDLGSSFHISKIDIFNRTDCCGNRLGNVQVMISDTPFTKETTSSGLAAALAHASWSGQISATPGNQVSFNTNNTVGRYILIQKVGDKTGEDRALSLAEVEVFGSPVVSNPLDIAQQPLFLSTSVPPNLMFIIDDSGSMKWSYIPDSILNRCSSTSSVAQRARGRSHDFNKMYFNPNATYLPPLKADGTRYPNANFTSAYSDGYQNTGGPTNLSTSFRHTWQFPHVAATHNRAYCGEAGPADYYTFNEGCAGGLEDTSCYTRHIVSESQRQNFANWYSYYRTRVLASRGGIGDAFNNLPNDFRLGWGRINQGNRTVDGTQQRAVIQGVRPLDATHKSAFYDWLHDSPDTGGTPLRVALQGAGQYFQNTTANGPYSTTPGVAGGDLLSCRQNFTILMSDGYWNGTTSPGVGNVDGEMGHPFEDTHSNTLADVAAYFWKNDLAPTLPNNVPTSSRNSANWQHMVTYTVGLGVFGSIDPETAFNAIATETPIAWPDPHPSDADEAKIDDMLHAAINSRGGFFSTADASAFAAELESVLLDIVARTTSSATALASTSLFLSDSSQLFQASFDSNGWSGNLKAYKPALNSNGGLDIVELWDAASKIPAHHSRSIFTHNGTGNGANKGIDFKWTAGITEAQKALLGNENVLNYVRGENITGFRARPGNIMGAIINSDPVYSHREHFGYHAMGSGAPESALYNAYVANKASRPAMVYVGANAGMLHAFDASTGVEKFAYVPSALMNKLPALTDPEYDHLYYVDGKIHISDAYIDDEWKTILIGTTAAGGKSIFALDISDPHNFSKTDVLWEFTHPELGYTFGEPVIGRLKNGTWAVIVGNGYNSNAQKSQLFVINLKTGLLERIIDTGEGALAAPNGLSAPAILYATENNNSFVSTVYAGDLQGNLWKFDLNNTNKNSWNVANSGSPLFVAERQNTRQPITVRPELKRHPAGGMMVLFGTGSFFTEQDPFDKSVQTLYGIRDLGNVVIKNNLQPQTIIFRGAFNGIDVTALSKNTVNYSSQSGWYLDLIYNNQAQGERLVTYPETWFNRFRVATTIPNASPCEPGALSWSMEIDYLTGGRLDYSIYDLDGNKKIDDDDMIQVDGEWVPVSGIKLDSPGALPSQVGDNLVIDPSRDSHGVHDLVYRSDLDVQIGRQTWREVR